MTARWTSPSTSLTISATVATRSRRKMSWASARRRRVEHDPTALRDEGAADAHRAPARGRSTRGPDRAGRRRCRSAGGAVQTPCSDAISSSVIVSQRSMIAAARGSVARASAFSSSVIVCTRRVSISSISVPSKKSPTLSGATAGKSYRITGEARTRSRAAPGRRAPASSGAARARGRRARPPIRRLEQRHEHVDGGGEQEVAADHRVQQGVLAGARRLGGGRGLTTRDRRAGPAAPSTAHVAPPDDPAIGSAPPPPSTAMRERLRRAGRDRHLDVAVRRRRPRPSRRRAGAGGGSARGRARRVGRPALDEHGGRHRRAPRPARRRPTGSACGSSPPSAGTGRARSPPTARRRRSRRPGRTRPRSRQAAITPPPRAAPRSVASQSVKPIRALYACSASRVSVRTRIQPPPGQYRSTVWRHVATGRR